MQSRTLPQLRRRSVPDSSPFFSAFTRAFTVPFPPGMIRSTPDLSAAALSALTMVERYHKALSENIRQTIRDSEEDYVNETFWRIYPSFLLVKSGDVEALHESLDIQLDRYDFRRRFTRDERKQLDYMAVSLINTFMIAGIEGGIYPPEANWIADRAQHRLLLARKPSDIPVIIEKSAVQLCEKVREAHKKDTGNPYAEKAKHYILTHISQEIAALFHFCDQSHFTQVFRRRTGMAPAKFRRKEKFIIL